MGGHSKINFFIRHVCEGVGLLAPASVRVMPTALLVSDRPVLFLTVTAAVAGQLAPGTQLQGFPVKDVKGMLIRDWLKFTENLSILVCKLQRNLD